MEKETTGQGARKEVLAAKDVSDYFLGRHFANGY